MNIIQTWKTHDVPPLYQPLVKKVRDLNPDWNYMFFDDNEIVTFIKTKMPEHYNTFVHLKHKIQQLDFFRYLVIYYYGGVYLDLDVELVLPLDKLYYDCDNECVFPIELFNITDSIITCQGYTNLIGNYAFYSPPRHPFIKQIIDNIVCQRISPENIRIAQSQNGDPPSQVYVYCTTGPLLVTQSYIDYCGKSVLLLATEDQQPNRFGHIGIHHCLGSWKVNNYPKTLA